MPDEPDETNFRGPVTQKALVRNPDGEVLLVRSGGEHAWSIPGGRVQEGEDAADGMARELREETDLSVRVRQPVHALTEAWYRADGAEMFTVVYACETTDTGVTLNHEHDGYAWVDVETAADRLDRDGLGEALDRARRVWRETAADH